VNSGSRASTTDSARAARAVSPPEQVAEVTAIACELPSTHGLPLGRFTRTELHRLVIERVVTDASATTIWRWLHDAAIKPWQVRSWLFPRDPDFAAKPDGFSTSMPAASRASGCAPTSW